MKTLSTLFFAIGVLVIMWGGFDYFMGTHVLAGVWSALVTALQAIL